MKPSETVEVLTPKNSRPILMIDENGAILIPIKVDLAPERAAKFVEACAFKLLAFAEEIRNEYGKQSLQ